MKKICILLSLMFVSVFSIHDVNASDTFLNDLHMDVSIQEDGSAHIKEIWDLSVYEGTEVYKVFNNLNESKISNLTVKDETGFQYQNIGEWNSNLDKQDKDGKCGLITKDNGYELCFGIGNYGDRVYTFEYDISYFVKQYNDFQGINTAFFSESTLEPRMAKIVVSSQFEFNEENSRIWGFGYNGDVVFEDGKVVMNANDTVIESGKMQLLMKINEPLFNNAYPIDENLEDVINDAKIGSDYNNDSTKSSIWIIPFIIISGIMIFGFVVLIGFVSMKASTNGKFIFNDKIPLKPKKDMNMFRDIPCDKDIFQFYFLAKKFNIIRADDRGGLIAAILLRWIQKGYIDFEKRTEKRLGVFKKDGYSIDLNKNVPCVYPFEQELLDYFRYASGTNIKLETKEFERWCTDNYEKVDKWFNHIDGYMINDLKNKGLLKIEKTYKKFLGMKVACHIDCYDASIREEVEHIYGLKAFLEEMSLIDEKEVIEVKMWEEYLIYGSILGIADKVQEQLGELCPTFNQQSELDTIYTMHMVHMFAYSSMRASNNAAQAASSDGFGGGASFGGGGGGFSGGGGAGVR